MAHTFILLSVLLGGCSSSKKSLDHESSKSASLDVSDSGDDALLEGLNTEQKKSSPVELEQKYLKLSQALKTKNEKDMLDAASLILFEDPDDVKTLNALAVYYINKGKVGLAKQYLSRALKKGAGESAVQNNLGVVLAAEGDQDAAITAYKRALASNSDNISAATNLGLIYAKYGAYEKSLPLLERAYDANKNDENLALAYAVSLRGMKKTSDAAKIYKGLASKSNDIAMLMDYAELLVNELKSDQEARTVLNKVRFLDPPGEVVDRVIQLERQLK